MFFDFSPENALELISLITPFIPILATYLLGRAEWPSWLKAALAFGVSAILAALTAYASGTLVENFWTNLFAIFTASQGIYWTFFKALGLERFVKPVEAVADTASQQASAQVAAMPVEQVKAIADPSKSTEVAVQTTVVV